MFNTTIYTSEYSTRHDTGVEHPENVARIIALEELFASAPFKDYPQKIARAADLDTILLAHDEDYIFDLQYKTPEQGLHHLDGDTVLSPDSYDAALHAAGAVIDAVEGIMRPRVYPHDALQNARAFCSIRPPGHHAESNKALGFCLLNNIFIGARHAQEANGIKKIAIVDFDVHHGNGTEAMCRAHNAAHPDKPIFYISTHGHPLFPSTGDPSGNNETLLNIHLPEQCNSTQFRDIYKKLVFPALNSFKPELLMLSSGFDAHKDDELANSALKTEDFGWIARKLCDIAAKYCQNRVISVLEGGYDIPSLTNSVAAHLKELAR